jgi:hypothetical protein
MKLQRGSSDAKGHPKDVSALRDLVGKLIATGNAQLYNLTSEYRTDLPGVGPNADREFFTACRDKGPLLIVLHQSNDTQQGFYWCRARGASSCKLGSLPNDFCAFWTAKKNEIFTLPLLDSTLFLTETGLHFQLEDESQCFRISRPAKLQLPFTSALADDAVLQSVIVYSFGP